MKHQAMISCLHVRQLCADTYPFQKEVDQCEVEYELFSNFEILSASESLKLLV